MKKKAKQTEPPAPPKPEIPSRKVGDMQVWWIPQIPMEAFHVEVSTVEEGVKIMGILADYDDFQFRKKVKPDYSNVGGIRVWCLDSDGEGNPGWEDWFDDETGFDDPIKYLEFKQEEKERAQSDSSKSS